MHEIKKGDIVSRKSYGNDIIFEVKRIMKIKGNEKVLLLKGLDVRIEADAPLDDVQIVTSQEREKRETELENKIISKIKKEKVTNENRNNKMEYTGRILHLDGDAHYR